MIAKTIVYRCRACGSQNLVKNGHKAYGSQQFWCKDCGKRGVVEPKHSDSAEQKAQILSAYTHERSSRRGLQRTFGISRNTLTSWLKKRPAKSKA
jgi:transposase-like protein